MNDTRTIMADLRHCDPAPLDDLVDMANDDTATAMLLRILETERGVQPAGLHDIGRSRSLRRPRRRPILVAAGVIAVVVAIVVVVLAPPGSPEAPKSAAAAVLAHAATVAADQPLGPTPGPGQYLYVKTLRGGTEVGSTRNLRPGWAFTYSETVQEWVAPNGSGRRIVTANPTVTFLTPQDQADWAASGQPMPSQLSTDGTLPPGSLRPPASANAPTTPAALERSLSANPQHTVTILFSGAGSILNAYGSPAVRSAIYQMIERLPGIQNLGPMTDHLGRKGVGIGLTTTTNGIQNQLIFDPTTSAVLQSQAVVAAPVGQGLDISGNRPTPLPDGTVIEYTDFLGTGIATGTSSVPTTLTP